MSEKELTELKAFIERKSAIMTQREAQLMVKLMYQIYILMIQPTAIIEKDKPLDKFDKALSVIINILTVLVGVALIVLATVAVYRFS